MKFDVSRFDELLEHENFSRRRNQAFLRVNQTEFLEEKTDFHRNKLKYVKFDTS